MRTNYLSKYLSLYKKTANKGRSGHVGQEAANIAAFIVEDENIAIFRGKPKGKVQLQTS